MKYLLAAIAVLGCALAGCAGGSSSGSTTQATSAEASPSSEPAASATESASPEASSSDEASAQASPSAAPLPTLGVSTPAPACSPGAGKLTATYYVLPAHHPDVEHGVDAQIVPGLVARKLGPDGLPVATQTALTGPQASGKIADVNGAGEILWWSASSPSGVKLEKVVADCLPIERGQMFADGFTDDETYYLTAHYEGYFTTPKSTTVGLSEGSDDDSWVFIDGSLVVDNGGVKPLADAPYTSAKLSPGQHKLDIFYADRHGSEAQFDFDPQFALTDAPPSPTPVPVASLPPTAKPAPSGIASQLKTQKRIRVYGIHFDVDKSTIQPQSESVIAQIAKVIQDNPGWRLRVEGHTDSDGGWEHNVVLSQARAQAVVDDLVNRYHIARSRLVAVGYSYSRPVAPNTTPANKALNRRVELVLL
ncbi:MAG TPA: OmpA family protein [Verrucomicrobiae bacterium]|nr:OmpA family protein [Verrucomicrobiae bacterium]